MKKVVLTLLLAVVGIFAVHAQNPVDLSKGKGSGITLAGSTLTSGTSIGEYVLPEQDYTNFKGLKLILSNFVKLDEAASNALASLNITYTDESGQDKKVSVGFWMAGRKDIRFSEFKHGNDEVISIKPASIKKIAIGMGANKKVDVSVELVPNKK